MKNTIWVFFSQKMLQILRRFFRQFYQAQTFYFWSVFINLMLFQKSMYINTMMNLCQNCSSDFFSLIKVVYMFHRPGWVVYFKTTDKFTVAWHNNKHLRVLVHWRWPRLEYSYRNDHMWELQIQQISNSIRSSNYMISANWCMFRIRIAGLPSDFLM